MNQNRIFQKGLLLLLIFISCDSTQSYDLPVIECVDPQLTANTTISSLKAMYKFGSPISIDSDLIITGYVVSDDKSGNIYKTLFVQDAPINPTSAISIAIDETALYSKYNVGRKIFIKLKGLSIGYNYGRIQIGKSSGNGLTSIPSSEIEKHIVRSCDVFDIVPKKVKISDINSSTYNMLLEIENAQFSTLDLGLTFANPSSNEHTIRIVRGFDSDCGISGELALKTSGFAKFKNQMLPSGKGSIVGICGNYYNDIELYLRNGSDVFFENERCDYSNAFVTTSSISEIHELFYTERVEFGVDSPLIIEGYVVSNDEQGNFQNRLVLQDAPEDPSSGIQVLLEKGEIFERYRFGDKVKIKLNKLYLDKIGGVLSIGIPKGKSIDEMNSELELKHIINTHENFVMVPNEIKLSKTKEEIYKGTLVKLIDVELVENELGKAYAYFSGSEDATRTLVSCSENERIGVLTNGNATFAHHKFPEGKGSISGVLGLNLELLKAEDVLFSEPYEICIVEKKNILISEVADPKNSVSARFVELYNADEENINLNGWKLNKYTNGSLSISSGSVALDNFIIPAKGYLMIANSGYQELFNDVPEITSNYISGNGDDVYELVNNIGETVDVYGEIGKDGNWTNWEYLDGRAVRKLEINIASPVFNKEEWIVFSQSSNDLVDFPSSAQNAPQDFGPRER